MKKIAATILSVSLFAVLGISQTRITCWISAPLFSAPAMDGTQLDMNELTRLGGRSDILVDKMLHLPAGIPEDESGCSQL